MELLTVKIEKPDDVNLILGQTHFIKSAEDIPEAILSAVPGARFGFAFNESSGPALVRAEGNDEELVELCKRNALNLGAGHVFLVLLRNLYPINVLNAIKAVPEVCTIYCATANPVEVILAETEQGRGVLGVIDGVRAKGIETAEDVRHRRNFLRRIGYKF